MTMCHKPNTPAEKTIQVPLPAVGAHLKHGDILGPCPPKVDDTPEPSPEVSTGQEVAE